MRGERLYLQNFCDSFNIAVNIKTDNIDCVADKRRTFYRLVKRYALCVRRDDDFCCASLCFS